MTVKDTQHSDIMEESNLNIHDFVSLYGNHAYIMHNGLALQCDLDYAKYVMGDIVDTPSVHPLFPVHLADIVEGVWCATCNVCKTVSIVRRSSRLWLCQTCIRTTKVVVYYTVYFRADWYAVEQVLLERPRVNRNAFSYESLDMLIKENKDNL